MISSQLSALQCITLNNVPIRNLLDLGPLSNDSNRGKGLDNDFPLSYRVCRVVVRPQVPHDRIFVMHSTEYKCAGEPALVALF